MNPGAVTAVVALIIAAVLVGTSLVKRPGIGVIVALVAIVAFVLPRPDGIDQLGLGPPESWAETLVMAAVIGTAISLLTMTLIEPLAERITGVPHDHSVVEAVRGNLRSLFAWVVIVWVLVAVVEEVIFRGFLMSAVLAFIGSEALGVIVAALLTSVVFGAAHAYQGRAGGISTGVVGILLAATFAWSGFNLWLPILVHGVIDTVSLVAIHLDLDRRLRGLIPA